MRKPLFAAFAAAALALSAAFAPALAQEAEEGPSIASLPWQTGPTQGKLGDRATIDVPEGFAFLGAEDTRRLNELMENPPAGVDEYALAPMDLGWIAYFRFDEVGYVKDDEELDPDDLLASIREGTEQGNIERRKRGWEALKIEGWTFKPQYDRTSNLLEWAILASGEQSMQKVVNYNTRLLGRKGVMEVVLVADPEGLDAAIGEFKTVLPGHAFNAGEKYAEFKPGDHVAEYGLAALVTGGAAAVASKKGFFAAIALFLAKAWKLVLVFLAGGVVFVRKLFGRKEAPSE